MRNTWSDGREQALVREFFGGGRRGFFVEVGANRPQFASQTWHLEELGWTGVLIEPQPDLADALRQARAATVFAVACSSPANAGRRMRLYVAGALSSLDRDRMAPGAEPEQVIDVPVRTLDDILIEAGAPQGFDLLSVDVEGHELEVLGGFDFARWQPRLILLEDHVGNLDRHRFLTAAGYRADPALREQWLVCSEKRARCDRMARTLEYRPQILSRAAVPDCAQCFAQPAPAASGAAALIEVEGLSREVGLRTGMDRARDSTQYESSAHTGGSKPASRKPVCSDSEGKKRLKMAGRRNKPEAPTVQTRRGLFMPRCRGEGKTRHYPICRCAPRPRNGLSPALGSP